MSMGGEGGRKEGGRREDSYGVSIYIYV